MLSVEYPLEQQTYSLEQQITMSAFANSNKGNGRPAFGSIERSDTLKYDSVAEALGGHDIQVFASDYDVYALPQYHMPQHSIPAKVCYQAITDLRQLDNNPRLNMASFVTTWMEEEADKLIKESLNVNMVDMDEYPSCTDIQNRCVSMLANLFNSPAQGPMATGTSCIGSSEAIMLAGLAMKKRWMARRKAAGLPFDTPNLVMSSTVQVCWHKFTRYWDVEERLVPIEEGRYGLTAELAKPMIDDCTIGLVGILGSTYNGEFEDIEALDTMVEELREEKGLDVPIHVDAASGGFIAPFLYPSLLWDFRLKNVKSINVSGHKYGLVYAGIGWVIWREPADLPEDLIFHVNYLGTDQATVTLNFSRGASHVIAQYFQLLRLGRDGYTRVMNNLANITARLAQGIMATGAFEMLSKEVGVPLVAFRLKPRTDEEGNTVPRLYDEYVLSDKLHQRGWMLPAYTMAENASHVKLLRAVIRLDHSATLISKLLEAIQDAVQQLDEMEQHSAQHFRSLQKQLTIESVRSGLLRSTTVKTTAQC